MQLFFSAFYWIVSISKHPTSPLASVKSTKSYEASLVTINRQTSYDSGILRQHYKIVHVKPAIAKRPQTKHPYRYHAYTTSKYTSNSRQTVSHASENSSSKMAVHACETLGYLLYKTTRVSAETSIHGEFPPQREQYLNFLHNVNSILIYLNVPVYFLSFSVYRKTFNNCMITAFTA